MIKKVIVRRPSRSMVDGINNNDFDKPDYSKAVKQHNQYIEALKKAKVDFLTVLDKDERYPDSCFVEDTAIVTEKMAVITNIKAESRKDETKEMKNILKKFYNNIEVIKPPAKVDGGDILRIKNKFFIGISQRTNEDGAKVLSKIFKKYGFMSENVYFDNYLHLKTGLSYIGNNTLLTTSYFSEFDNFAKFDKIIVDKNEEYAANSIRVNDKVIMPAGFLSTKKKLIKNNFEVIEVDVSEYQKLDGGVSCLSLRF